MGTAYQKNQFDCVASCIHTNMARTVELVFEACRVFGGIWLHVSLLRNPGLPTLTVTLPSYVIYIIRSSNFFRSNVCSSSNVAPRTQ